MTLRTLSLLSLGLLLVFALGSVLLGLWRASMVPTYWRARATEPISADSIRVVALGDSAMQAIGADHPEEGIAGRVETYLEWRTGRAVHLTNLSQGGATVAQVIMQQLPYADVEHADLILVATSNDLEKRVSLETYRATLRRFLAALPTAKTVVSDLPLEPGRRRYQQILREEADQRGIARADFATVFNRARRLDIFSWLVPHLNSRGYALWFEAFRTPIEKLVQEDSGNL